MLNNKIYNALKWLVMIVLPALATFYTTLGGIWGLPYVEQIPATLTALATFLGAVCMISSKVYANKQATSSDSQQG